MPKVTNGRNEVTVDTSFEAVEAPPKPTRGGALKFQPDAKVLASVKSALTSGTHHIGSPSIRNGAPFGFSTRNEATNASRVAMRYAKLVGESLGKVPTRSVYNAGSEEAPMWRYAIGIKDATAPKSKEA